MDAIKNTTKKFIKGLFKPENKLSLIPNWLSFSRVIGGIMIPIMAYTNAPISMLFGTISFLSISDFLDGLAARKIAKEENPEILNRKASARLLQPQMGSVVWAYEHFDRGRVEFPAKKGLVSFKTPVRGTERIAEQ